MWVTEKHITDHQDIHVELPKDEPAPSWAGGREGSGTGQWFSAGSDFCHHPLQGIWHYLDLTIITRGQKMLWHLAEARDASKHLTRYRTAPSQWRISLSKMLMMLTSRNPGEKQHFFSLRVPFNPFLCKVKLLYPRSVGRETDFEWWWRNVPLIIQLPLGTCSILDEPYMCPKPTPPAAQEVAHPHNWCFRTDGVNSHLRGMDRDADLRCALHWVTFEAFPKVHILWFHFEMAFVFVVPVLEWREATPWPQPMKSLCFVHLWVLFLLISWPYQARGLGFHTGAAKNAPPPPCHPHSRPSSYFYPDV